MKMIAALVAHIKMRGRVVILAKRKTHFLEFLFDFSQKSEVMLM
jgi:hypothetical protein